MTAARRRHGAPRSTDRTKGTVMKLILSAAAFTFAAMGLAGAPTAASAQELRTNRVSVDYLEPRNTKLQGVYDRMRQRKVLEEYAQFLAPLRLPTTLRIWGFECDMVNAYYSPQYRAIHICYEYVDKLEKGIPKGDDLKAFSANEALVGGFVSVILHETGHAMRDFLNIPVFGREEDAADQVAEFVALQFGKDTARLVTKGAAWLWLSEARGAVVPDNFADEHSTSAERFFNYLCLGYGGDPATFKDLAEAFLPKTRAPNCAREYQQTRIAFDKTILPFIDPAMMKKAQATQWFQASEMK
jgi:hypothetical protein